MQRNVKVAIASVAVIVIGVAGFLIYRRVVEPPQPSPCPVILTIWQTETDKVATQHLAETVALFEQQNPCVKVRLELVAWSALSAKLAVALQRHN